MASGKSAVGKQLSDKLKMPFIDLDSYIENHLNTSISEIFDKKGEIFFRLKESECLKELLNREDNFILSLGGGTPCYAGNMDLIENSGSSRSFYLKTSVKTICSRLINEQDKRPIVARVKSEELPEFIAKHLFERSFFYEKATFNIKTDDKKISEISEEIAEIILNKP